MKKVKAKQDKVKLIDLSTDSIELLEFLQSDFCKEIFIENKLKIHIETGNIFFNNLDTSESIYGFFQHQENQSKAKINFEFSFTDSDEDYFDWLVQGFKGNEDQKFDVLTNKNSKYLFYWFNDYLERLLQPIKPICHSIITDDDLVLEVIQKENWQYFIETILTACKTNNAGINNTINLKNINLIKNSIENITICKQTYLNFYNQISQYLTNTIRNLPVDERNEIDCDLQKHNYFINLGETNDFSDHNIIDIFCNFFQQHGRFPGSQDLIVVPKPEIPYFIKANKVISTNQLYEKISSTDARALVSIQALAALNMYYGGSAEISRQALTEFLHNMSHQALNMSHQALNKDNYNIFIQFDRTAELITELIFVLLDRNNKSLSIASVINDNVNNKINYYQFTFDIPAEIGIEIDMEDILKDKKSHQHHFLPMFYVHY